MILVLFTCHLSDRSLCIVSLENACQKRLDDHGHLVWPLKVWRVPRSLHNRNLGVGELLSHRLGESSIFFVFRAHHQQHWASDAGQV